MTDREFDDFFGPYKRVGGQWELFEFGFAVGKHDNHPHDVYKIEP